MGWFDDVCDWVDDNIVDPVTDAASDAASWVDDNIVDPVEQTVSDTIDWVDDNLVDPTIDHIEEAGEWVADTVSDAADAIGDFLDSVGKTAEEFWDSISEAADDLWDNISDSVSAAWEWLEDGISDIADWIEQAATTVFDFVVDEALPFIISILELIPAVMKALGALLILPLCYLYKKIFGEEEATVIQGIAAHEPRLMEEFNIARLPVDRKYVVFSDVHMFVEGDLDFFNRFGNSTIYNSALLFYNAENFHLVENGDIEDFWMRGGSSKGMILNVADNLPWPFYYNSFLDSAGFAANTAHAMNLLSHNRNTYATIRALFHDNGRYTRLIGNHDDVWDDDRMDVIYQNIYPGSVVNHYCTLDSRDTGDAAVVIAHGHQSDVFNMPMCNFAGKAITKLASILNEVSVGNINMFATPRSEWMEKWNGMGFDNELTEFNLLKLESFSEKDIYSSMENIYGDSPTQPYLVFGHTHHPKDNAGVPGWMYERMWNWNEYSNSGNTGMWEGIVTCIEIEHPEVRVAAWLNENGSFNRYILNSYTYGDTYLK